MHWKFLTLHDTNIKFSRQKKKKKRTRKNYLDSILSSYYALGLGKYLNSHCGG